MSIPSNRVKADGKILVKLDRTSPNIQSNRKHEI
jgi:hypothetical protein